MINFKELELEKVVYYKHAKLDLSYTGITNIRGRNLDAKIANRSNGAGKSLLVSPLADLCVNASPVIVKGHNKKALYSQGSRVRVSFDERSIIRETKGASVKYQLEEGGRELNPRTPDLALSMIREWLPFTEEQFFSLIYIDSRRPAPLHFGTAISRLNFITSLWHLDSFDRLHKVFNRKIAELKADNSVIESLREELSRFDAALEGVDYDNLVEVYRANKSKSAKLQEEIDRLYVKLNKATEQAHRIKLRESVNERLAKHDWSLDTIAEKRHELRRLIAHAHKVDNQREQYLNWKRKIKSVRAQLDTTISNKQLQSNIKTLKQKIDELNTQNARASERRQAFKAQRSARKTYVVGVIALCNLIDEYGLTKLQLTDEDTGSEHRLKHLQSKVSKLLGECEFRVEINEKTADTLEKADGSCPVCGTVLTKKQIQALFDKAKSVCRETALLIKGYYQVLKMLQTLNYVDKPKEANFDIVDTSKLDAEYDALLEQVHVRKKFLELKAEKPESVEGEEYDLQALQKQLTDAEYILEHKNDLDVEEVDIDREEVQARLTKLQEQQAELINKQPQQYARINEYKTNYRHRKPVLAKIADLESKLGDLPAYRLLVDAYSQKGVKRIVVNRICEAIERNMNRYSGLLFPEPIRFKFELTATKFDILATRTSRGKRKREVTSDVKLLSGSEGRSFDLLSAISMLPLIGSQRRCNILILDEALANVDQATKDLIYTDFLPALNQVVPHVVNIDISDDNIPGARELYAVKRNGISRLLTPEEMTRL